MADTWDQDQLRKLVVRGLGWCLCLGLWTAALLTTYPVKMGEAVTPSGLYFPASKCLHVSAYAFLTVYLTWMPLGRWRWLLLALLSLHGAGTELLQLLVPERYGRLSDVLIDHLGLALGMALTWKHWRPHSSRWSFSRNPKGNTTELARSPSGRG